MSFNAPLPISVALVVGLILGWLVRGGSSIDEQGVASIDESGRFSRGANQPEESRERSGRTSSRGQGDEGLEVDEDDETFRVDSDDITRLIGAKVESLEERAQLMDPDDPLEQVIGVTDEEAKKLNGLWHDLKPSLDSLRSDHVIHQELENGGIWFGVEPFPEEGESLRESFLLTIIETLGEARARTFLNAISAHRAFGQWGKSVGSGFAVHTFVQEDESIIYEIYEDSRVAGKRGRKWNSSTIPPHLKKLVMSSDADLPGLESGQ
jgi:hypothetical protein